MKMHHFPKLLGTGAAVAAIALVGLSFNSPRLNAEDDRDSEAAKVRVGLQIAPVQLNLHGRNPNLVGLGSYIVNAQASCNDCHSAGPAAIFAPGGNPYFGQHPTVVNPITYLGGGRDFGPLLPPDSAHIYSRNLTPDKSGLPMGDTFEKFLHTIQTGEDPDHVHPTCSTAVNSQCIPHPFDGSLLQIMPWPVLRNMTQRDLRAIYEYLSAIPCVEGGPGEPAHRCQ